MKVLCAADLHLGRRSSRLPANQNSRDHSCAGAWQAIVDIALSERVDLVALSGDVVDRENRYFEAIGPLESGVRDLANAGITTLAVTGNHDFDVLPQVADALDSDHFRVLGRGGEWERFTLSREGRPSLYIDGWSFPRQDPGPVPLDDYDLPQDGTPVLGLLHTDLDQMDSRYGPVSLTALRQQPVALWALGHIHAPAIHEQPRSPVVFYPGSPQAMDPGEQGPHGAVIVEIGASGAIEVRRAQTSSVLYTTLTVDLSDVESQETAGNQIFGGVRDTLSSRGTGAAPLRCISCRVTVTGRTPLHVRLPALLADAEDDLKLQSTDGVEAVVERIDIETRPALDLAALSSRNDLPGELARIIRALETEQSGDYEDLITTAARQLSAFHKRPAFAPIATDPEPDAASARRYVLREAWMLLDKLITQRDAA